MRTTLMVAVLCCTTLGAASAQDSGGYEQDTVNTDGPIIYGTGMNDADRQRAWKHFFYMMVEACGRQQGKDALTAAAVAQLDRVIMTDSAVAHLAGAIGKPVWLLLGQTPHWLWLLERADTPWYPTLRLFRSNAGSDWDAVFDAVSAELMELAKPQLRQLCQPTASKTRPLTRGATVVPVKAC
jgi:hypothetical protein